MSVPGAMAENEARRVGLDEELAGGTATYVGLVQFAPMARIVPVGRLDSRTDALPLRLTS